MIKYYRDKEPQPFRAVQFDLDADNSAEVIAFAKGAVYWQGLILVVKAPYMDDDYDEIMPGDWVIETTDGGFIQYDKAEFEEDFEPADYYNAE